MQNTQEKTIITGFKAKSGFKANAEKEGFKAKIGFKENGGLFKTFKQKTTGFIKQLKYSYFITTIFK